jgi:hypothetical protein
MPDSERAYAVLVRDKSYRGCFKRYSADDAVSKARELQQDGARRVAIRDWRGNMYGPSEFYLIKARTA